MVYMVSKKKCRLTFKLILCSRCSVGVISLEQEIADMRQKLVSNLASHDSFSWRLDIIEIEQSAKFIL